MEIKQDKEAFLVAIKFSGGRGSKIREFIRGKIELRRERECGKK